MRKVYVASSFTTRGMTLSALTLAEILLCKNNLLKISFAYKNHVKNTKCATSKTD